MVKNELATTVVGLTDDGLLPATNVPEGTVWKLLKNDQIVSGTTAPTDASNQVIYVTYQDPNDPSGNKTLQVLSHLVNIIVKLCVFFSFILIYLFLEW